MTPPHRAIRSWTQLLIAGRLNLVCHQIPVGGRDGDVVQRATRPPLRQRLTPTEASSRKWQQKFALKPEASPLSALSLLLSGENWLGGNLNAPRCSTQNGNVSVFFLVFGELFDIIYVSLWHIYGSLLLMRDIGESKIMLFHNRRPEIKTFLTFKWSEMKTTGQLRKKTED